MEEKQLDPREQEVPAPENKEQTSAYTPRPLWQRIIAWIGLVLFVLVILMYYINIMRGAI